MTYTKKIRSMLVNNGLAEEEAEVVVKRMRETARADSEWDKDRSAADCREAVPQLWNLARQEAVSYLASYKPDHLALLLLKK